MAYKELLSWSRNRPLWQQDALRRIALHGELTDDDLAEFRLHIQHTEGLPAENVPVLVPLAAEHLSHAISNDPRTVIASLGPVRHVDRLSADQPPLRFAVNGVTVVYGANASGKSGYCRIAKQLCRSRSTVELRGNVYHGEGAKRPEVSVAFRVGGDDQLKEERVWFKDQAPPNELSRISIFDTATARVYIDKKRKIEFLPYELDLMNKMGLASRSLEKTFKERLDSVNAEINVPLPEGYQEGTAVQTTLARLVVQTAISDLPGEQELRGLGTWTAEMQHEIAVIEEQLEKDPQVMIRLRKEAKQALEVVGKEISRIEGELADKVVADLGQKQRQSDDCNRAAIAAAKALFAEQPIPDIGSETWRRMLAYAREFASTVFPDAPPPRIAEGGRCVLCQQELDENSAARMAAFDDYIAGRATEESTEAARLFDRRRDAIMAFEVKDHGEIQILLAGYAALSDTCGEGVASIAAFVKCAGERLETVKGIVRENRYDALEDIKPLLASPARFVEREINRLNIEIGGIEIADHDDDALAKLRARHADLSDRKRLSEEIEIVVERRNRLEERHKLDACRKQCRTTTITLRITKRRREILTPALKSNLREELKRLRLTHLPLNLSDRGQGAESIVEIALDARQRVRNNSDVLSEGEQRALALACFLAELHEVGGDHAIIVDDPVSSLDHDRIQSVAARLAEEAAKGRQVIVFTHNILFHHMISTETRRAGVGLHSEWMRGGSDGRFGLIDKSGQPWQMKNVRDRLGEIGKEYDTLSGSEYNHTDQKFRPAIIGLYTKMRETWERIIEEILFNNAVQRFRPEIMTQRLEEACINPRDDYPLIYEGMKRCSYYCHDRAQDLPTALPESDRISRDIEDLKGFAKMAMDRRGKFRKDPRYEDGVKPILL